MNATRTETTAAVLCADPDRVAPVSGCRCRDCGHNALYDDPETPWIIEHMATYCRECAAEKGSEA